MQPPALSGVSQDKSYRYLVRRYAEVRHDNSVTILILTLIYC
jgi:hypothetical protein